MTRPRPGLYRVMAVLAVLATCIALAFELRGGH